MTENPFDERAEQVRQNILQIKQNVCHACQDVGRDPAEVQLMAVTKTVPAELVNIAIQEGICLLYTSRTGGDRQQPVCKTGGQMAAGFGRIGRCRITRVCQRAGRE